MHCRETTEDVRTNIVRCVGCDRWLLVRDHYSRRLAAYMGVMVDAEAPGELPPDQGGVPMSDGQTIAVEVTGIEQITPLIKHFTLARIGGGALPAFSGGSHIVVVMRGEAGGSPRVHRNPYSLLSPPYELDTYQIAVRRMEESRGGSHFMHDRVQVGSGLEIAHPVNLFALDKIARKHVLIAGGIGITPILAQLEDLHGGAIPYELHYSVRAPEHAAFLARLRAREGERVRMYYDSEGQLIDFEGLLAQAAARAPTCTSAVRPA
jgi:ferredoxin-NADP reductase